MVKEIAFFDLDNTLWKLRNKILFIDKEKPGRSLFTISSTEFALINNGIYRKDNLKIDYNGKVFFINKKMFDRACKKANTENIERFGISFMNFTSKELLNNSEIEILTDNIHHLRDEKFIDIGLLTARSNQRNHSDILNKLRLALKNMGVEIKKIFFISSVFNPKTTDDMSMKKLYVLIEHLIGFKIKDGKFIDEKQDWYQAVHFYDDDEKNINVTYRVQVELDGLLKRTDDILHRIIMDRLEQYKLALIVNYVSTNELNRFKRKEIILNKPLLYKMSESKIIKKFNDF